MRKTNKKIIVQRRIYRNVKQLRLSSEKDQT